jgi:hypothetical protein
MSILEFFAWLFVVPAAVAVIALMAVGLGW